MAGDLFDRWDSSPEVVNLALEWMPKCYAVPGQHDLPHHRYEDIKKSAYYSLVLAGVVTNLKLDVPTRVSDELVVTGFPWGCDPMPPSTGPTDGEVRLAVLHAFCWKEGHEHPGATADTHVDTWAARLAGFDAAVFGDNHRGFRDLSAEIDILNHGTFLQRRTDEKDLVPRVGFLMEDGQWGREALDIPAKWADMTEIAEPLEAIGLDAEELLELLSSASTGVLSFRDTVAAWLRRNKVGSLAEAFIIRWLEKARGQSK